jgi:hypothetical protein
VDKNGKWPTEIHNQIIDEAFPNLTDAQRQILKDVSLEQDSILEGGQSATLAYQHAMRAPWESVSEAQAEYEKFVSSSESQATKTQVAFWAAGNTGLSDDALAKFALALHAIEDSTSPVHEGFQIWRWWNPFQSLIDHPLKERRITPALFQAAVSLAQATFNRTFIPPLPSRQSLVNFGSVIQSVPQSGDAPYYCIGPIGTCK